MVEQIFSDGIGSIAVIGGTVRIDFMVLSPNPLINRYEMRRPRPVLLNPRDSKKADTMSQMVELENPASSSLMLARPRNPMRLRLAIEIAPSGIG